MRTYRNIKLLGMIICALAMPSVLAVAIYLFTDDPTLRPLGITREKLDERELGAKIEIIAYIRWNATKERVTKDAFGAAVVQAFEVKDITPRLEITDVADQNSTVTYQVGPSQIGPFSTAAAAGGIKAAVAAYQGALAHQKRVKTP